jgi:Zn-finger domain-containing protein
MDKHGYFIPLTADERQAEIEKAQNAERMGELAFLNQYKESYQNPRQLDELETIEFISLKVNLGHPEIVPYSGRGARSKKTQYDLAYDRRKGLYHRLVRVPISLPQSGAKGRLKIGDSTKLYIKELAEELSLLQTPKRQRTSSLCRFMVLKNRIYHDRKTISKYLKILGY